MFFFPVLCKGFEGVILWLACIQERDTNRKDICEF